MNNVQAPEWVFKFVRLFCPPDLVEEIEGDLIQLFESDAKVFGKRRAKLRLLWASLRFFRPGILLRNKFSIQPDPLPMFFHYFKTTLRGIHKSKVNFTFKLGGLSLAIFSFLVIAIYVSYQLSFDTFHDDYQKIYRVNAERKENGQVEKYAISPLALGPMLQQHFPEVASAARVRFANTAYLRYNNTVTECQNLIEADTSLFHVLTFQFIRGNKDALKKPNSIVLTREKATRVFGSTDVLGKEVSVNNGSEVYEVTAIIEDTKSNSHLFVSAIIPIHREYDLSLNSIISPVDFVDQAATLYVRFKNSMPSNFAEKVESLLDRFIKKSDRIESGFAVSLQPIEDIYLGPHYKYEFSGKGSSVYLYAFSTLGILLLIVAGINYINLSIADFSGRSRETGVRKVLGARKYQFVLQVAVETLLYCLASVALALTLLYVLFPQILQMLDTDLRLEMLSEPRVLLIIFAGLCTLLTFATYFPARQFTTTGILQNLKSTGAAYNSSVSQVLLFTQFTISAICICCTVMVGRQISFIYNKELGFNKKDLIVFSLPEDFTVKKMQVLKHNLKEIAGVTAVSNSSFRIGGGYWKDWYFVEHKQEMKPIELYEVFSDDELFTTLGIKLLNGRTFNANMPSDSSTAFVINETAARELGWEDPIGKRIYTHPEEKSKWDGTIVGVVSDINISALYEKVHPLVMRLPWQNEYPDGFVYVRYHGDGQAVARAIEEKYQTVMPGYPLQYLFVDEFYKSRHQKESKAFSSLQFGTLVIVLVSMLGIFSLAAYMSVRRMKEFGIRKVLGATMQQIAQLHIGYFVQILMISNVLALPMAYWLIKEWLNGFAYRVELTFFPFLLVAVLSFLLILISAGYSAWKAGRMNPVEVIKAE
jgi:putative ABC transport system permease protein